MAQTIAPRRNQRLAAAPVRRISIDLASLHGEVHRFTGVVDRFGSFVKGGATIRTLCIRELRLDGNSSLIHPDHWWFRLREVWSEAGVRVGDTVVFTAKVQRCTKGWDGPGEVPVQPGEQRRNREQVMGFGASPRSVVVVKRREGGNQLLSELGEVLEQTNTQLELAREDLSRIEEHRNAVLEQADRIQRDLQASRTELKRLRSRARKAAVLLLCLGSVGGFTLGWRSAQWKQTQGINDKCTPTAKPSAHSPEGVQLGQGTELGVSGDQRRA